MGSLGVTWFEIGKERRRTLLLNGTGVFEQDAVLEDPSDSVEITGKVKPEPEVSVGWCKGCQELVGLEEHPHQAADA